jgi:hypothetical protein
MMIMQRVNACMPVCVIAAFAAGCGSDEHPPVFTGRAGVSPQDPEYWRPDVVNLNVEPLTDADGAVLKNPVARRPFVVSGSFGIAEGTNPEPPPVIIKVRDRHNIVHDSASARSQKENGRYAFQAEIDDLNQAGSYTLEIRVQGKTIQEQTLEVP